MMKKAAAFVALLLAAAPVYAEDAVTQAGNEFYSAIVGSRSLASGGIPDAATRARLQPLLTPRLNKALADAAAAEARFAAKNKNSPPLIEGDIFSSLFEGPTAFKVGVCKGDDKIQRCAVSLSRQDPGQKPVGWADTLILANSGGWKVDDIGYDANFAFGNTGTLS